jgi:hypothetical protein
MHTRNNTVASKSLPLQRLIDQAYLANPLPFATFGRIEQGYFLKSLTALQRPAEVH